LSGALFLPRAALRGAAGACLVRDMSHAEARC
jgi:hypothetical protein